MKYLIYKKKYNAYYRPNNAGYTSLKEDAGRYDLDDREDNPELQFIPEDQAEPFLGQDAKNEFYRRRSFEAFDILHKIKWNSADKDNMEFDSLITYVQKDNIDDFIAKFKARQT